ncbi:MAG: hypothetical protein IKF07_01675 [Eubacterium sp.]|nr:hypothetical protein [Eubacterium sp.]
MQKAEKKRIIHLVRGLIIISVVSGVLYAASFAIDMIRSDPNFEIKHTTKTIKTDETIRIKYKSSRRFVGNRTYIPAICFKPKESSSYTFTISDIKSDKGVYLKVNVMDSKLSGYVYDDNIPRGKKGRKKADKDLTGSALLNKGKKYYIIVDIVQEAEHGKFSGSFDLTVTKTPKEDGPQEIKVAEKVRVEVEPNENASVLFTPDESGYYRFESVITGKRAVAGFSGIASVISDAGDEKEVFGGISYLDSGTDYYVTINTDDTENRKIKADISCTRLQLIQTDAHGTVDITGETLIEYTAPYSETAALWSESDGDPQAVVYDRQSVPLNSDNNSGKEFSGNKSDFALIFQTEKFNKYRIFIGGTFDSCKVSIGCYTGDGSTLGPEDVTMEDEASGSDLGSSEDTEGQTPGEPDTDTAGTSEADI